LWTNLVPFARFVVLLNKTEPFYLDKFFINKDYRMNYNFENEIRKRKR